MKLLYQGKTKDVYDLENGTYWLKFKDDTTVNDDGEIDPGGNTVGATIDGLGQASLRLTKYYFEKINAAGVFTHYLESDLAATAMTVRPATLIGKGLEVICRLKAVGSFLRRYGDYCTQAQDLDFLVEVSLKDNERGDPFITKDTLEMLGILSSAEYDDLSARAKQITAIIRGDLAARGLDLYDIKFEFGRIDGKIALIDEFSWGIMRVYKNGEWLQPFELSKYFA